MKRFHSSRTIVVAASAILLSGISLAVAQDILNPPAHQTDANGSVPANWTVVVLLTGDGKIHFQESANTVGRAVNREELAELASRHDSFLLLADRSVAASDVAQILSLLRQSAKANPAVTLREPRYDANPEPLVSVPQAQADSSKPAIVCVTMRGDGRLEWSEYSSLDPPIVRNQAVTLEQLAVLTPNGVPVRVQSGKVGSSRVDLQACKLEYSIVSPK